MTSTAGTTGAPHDAVALELRVRGRVHRNLEALLGVDAPVPAPSAVDRACR